MRMVTLLIEKNVSIDNIEKQGIYLIDAASNAQNLDLVSFLLTHGATLRLEALETLVVGFEDREYHSSKREQVEEREVRLGNFNLLFKTILMCGAVHGSLTAGLLLLMETEAKKFKNKWYSYHITSLDENKLSAMHYAAMHGQEKTISLLCRHGGKPLIHTSNFLPGLHQTIVANHRLFRGYTPLALAVQNRHVECVKTLLSLGADPFASSGASVLNLNPACPYWLSLDVKIIRSWHAVEGWINDESEKFCFNCHAKFTVLYKSHRCKFCDHILCKNCSRWNIIGLRACEKCALDYENADSPEDYVQIMRSRTLDEGEEGTKGDMISPHTQSTYVIPKLSEPFHVDSANTRKGILNIMFSEARLDDFLTVKRQRVVLRRWKKFLEQAQEGELSLGGNVDEDSSHYFEKYFDSNKENIIETKVAAINGLMEHHSKVQGLRLRFSYTTFFVKVIYFCLYIFIAFIVSLAVLHFNGSNSSMAKRIRYALTKETRGLTLGESPASLWSWIEGDFFPKALPNIYDKYTRIGIVRVVQTRHVNINSQHNGTQIERLQLVPSIHRHSNSMEPWGGGVKGKTFVPKENNGKYIIDINPNDRSTLQNLRNDTFLDNRTKEVGLKFMVYSANLEMYCLTHLKFTYDVGGIWKSNVLYNVFYGDVSVSSMPWFSAVTGVLFIAYVLIELISLVQGYIETCPTRLKFIYTTNSISKSNKEVEHSLTKAARSSFINRTFEAFQHRSPYEDGKKISCRDRCKLFSRLFKPMLSEFIIIARFAKIVYVGISAGQVVCFFILSHLTQSTNAMLRSTPNLEYYESLEEIANISYLFRIFFSAFLILSTLQFLQNLSRLPIIGKYILAMRNTIQSMSFISFTALFIVLIFVLSQTYYIMLNEQGEWNGFSDSFNLLFSLGVLGDYENSIYMPENTLNGEDNGWLYMLSMIVQFVVIIFLMNLLIAIMSDSWHEAVSKDLWSEYINEKMQKHMSLELGDMIVENNILQSYILSYLWKKQEGAEKDDAKFVILSRRTEYLLEKRNTINGGKSVFLVVPFHNMHAHTTTTKKCRAAKLLLSVIRDTDFPKAKIPFFLVNHNYKAKNDKRSDVSSFEQQKIVQKIANQTNMFPFLFIIREGTAIVFKGKFTKAEIRKFFVKNSIGTQTIHEEEDILNPLLEESDDDDEKVGDIEVISTTSRNVTFGVDELQSPIQNKS